MSQAPYQRGTVVKGPNPFSPAQHRPYVKLSDTTHPFGAQEGIFVAVTTTQRPESIELRPGDFLTGGLLKRSYASPWVVTTFKYADLQGEDGRLQVGIVNDIAEATAGYIGVSP